MLLSLKGRYWDENANVEKVDIQEIPLFEDNKPLKLDFENRVIEEAWYKEVKIKVSWKPEHIYKIDLNINDDQIICDVTNIVYYDTGAEIYIKIPEEKKQLFLLYYEFVQIQLTMQLSNNESKTYISNQIPCVSKNISNYKNVENMITEIIEFEDDEINEWIFNIDSLCSSNGYGLLQGGLIRNASKSLNSYVKLLKEIYSAYYKNIYLFKNQTKHVVTKKESMISYDRVKKFTSEEFLWLMQNTEQMTKSKEETIINYKGINYLPRVVKTKETVRNTDVYENRIIYSFLKQIVKRLTMIKTKFQDDVIYEKDLIEKFNNIKAEGFNSPIILIKESQLRKWSYVLKELEILLNSFQKLLGIYSNIFCCKEIRTDCIPRQTKAFKSIRHYKEIYKLILKWFKYGDFNPYKEELLLKVKKIDKIFEYYALIRILKKAKDMGYKLEKGGAIYYKYGVKDHRFEEPDINNTYYLTNDSEKLVIYYQPVIFSSENNSDNNIKLFRTDSNSYWVPDFLFCVEHSKEKKFYAISDAKYSSRRSISKFYMMTELVNYVCSIADKNGQTPAVRFMWILQGREHSGTDTTEYYHRSKLAKSVKPIPSYGIQVLNPSQKNLDAFWDELMRCLREVS